MRKKFVHTQLYLLQRLLFNSVVLFHVLSSVSPLSLLSKLSSSDKFLNCDPKQMFHSLKTQFADKHPSVTMNAKITSKT